MVQVYSPVTPGENIMHTGSDMMQGELLLQQGQLLGPRETAVIAAQGIPKVDVYKRPVVGIISTGDEVIRQGVPYEPGKVYDTNTRIISDMAKELGALTSFFGIVGDEAAQIRSVLKKALRCDIVIMSGGTSAGEGDHCYKALEELGELHVHGVAIKPGKPVALGTAEGKPVLILPGFPTSCAITFNVFARSLILEHAGLTEKPDKGIVEAKLAARHNSDKGKHEYVLVNLVKGREGLYAYPIAKGSGSITTFAFADGFFEIGGEYEAAFADKKVKVRLLADRLKVADICLIGSHCVMLEPAVSMLRKKGFIVKVMHVGSTAGIMAARRGEADVTGTHLLDEKTKEYNKPFMEKGLALVREIGRAHV